MKRPLIGLVALSAVFAAACASTSPTPNVASTAACEQLGNSNTALEAFYRPGNVYSAHKAENDMFIGRASIPKQLVGAELSMHAQPGVDDAYMQRVLSCHAASGHSAHPNDPLVPDHGRVAEVDVSSSGDSLRIRVTGSDRATAESIWRRAQAFAAESGAVRVEQVARTASPTRL